MSVPHTWGGVPVLNEWGFDGSATQVMLTGAWLLRNTLNFTVVYARHLDQNITCLALSLLQALEHLGDLTLESWHQVFSHKLICRLQFGDDTISAVPLHALRLRVEHPHESYTSAEPLHNLVFEFRRGIIGRHGFDNELRCETTVPLRWTVLGKSSAAHA